MQGSSWLKGDLEPGSAAGLPEELYPGLKTQRSKD